MNALILSGLGGGDNNPLPLILPIWIVIAILYSINFLVRFIKKKRLQNQDKLINELTAHIEPPHAIDNTDQNIN